ncbi:MAG: hypothetical protein Q9160_000258 [Pyrenula sp. 1 TL-2023]
MDFEMAIWEMTSLMIAPKKVFKSIYYHVRTPFPLPYASSLAIRTTRTLLTQTKNTYHRPDPSFTYLLSFFLLLSALAWGLAYTPSPSAITKLALSFIFIHFLLGSLLLSTFMYFLVGRFLGPGVKGLPRRRRGGQGLFGGNPADGANQLEFGYCFDVSIRAFFPLFTLLHILQFLLMPLLRHPSSWASTLAGNTLYLAAFSYWTIVTFLGYHALHFLEHTELLLSPMLVWVVAWVVCAVGKVNLVDWGARAMFVGVR